MTASEAGAARRLRSSRATESRDHILFVNQCVKFENACERQATKCGSHSLRMSSAPPPLAAPTPFSANDLGACISLLRLRFPLSPVSPTSSCALLAAHRCEPLLLLPAAARRPGRAAGKGSGAAGLGLADARSACGAATAALWPRRDCPRAHRRRQDGGVRPGALHTEGERN